MKNKLLLLLILGVTFFSACSDDDDKDYDGTYSGDQLKISVSNVELSGKEAVLEGTTLTLKNAIPGEATTVFTLTEVGDRLVGKNENDNRELSLIGNKEKKVLALAISMKVKAAVVGKWDLIPFDLSTGLSSPLLLNLETEKENVAFGTNENPEDNLISSNDFVMNIRYIMFGPILAKALQNVSLEEDGNVVASYTADVMGSGSPTYTTSPKGLVLYNVVGNKIYIGLNIDGIQSDLGRSEMNPLAGLMTMVEAGIPLEYTLTGNDLNVYLTRETLLPVMDIVPLLGTILPENFQFFAPLLSQIATIVKESKKFDVGLMMTKAEE